MEINNRRDLQKCAMDLGEARANYSFFFITTDRQRSGLTHQCLYFEQPHTFEQILFIQTAEPALVGHAQIT